MAEYIDKCKKCYHFQVCANVMKNQLFIREKMLLEENPECEHFIPAEDVVEVIRCIDCKFWDAVRNTKYKGTGICKPPNLSLIGGYCVRRGATRENDYCSGAKRKDGD